MDEMEPTIDQKKEWSKSALESIGFEEMPTPGIFAKHQDDRKILVDLNEKKPSAIFIINGERVAIDDTNETLVKINQIIVDAEMGAMKGALLKRAQAHPQYDGFEAGIIVKNEDGKLERRPGSFMLGSEELLGGWAKVYRKDTKHPVVSEVTLEEYIGRKKTGEVNKMWSSKTATMIRKVPLMQGLRESFAEELNGMFDRSEMNMGEAEVV